MTGARHMVLPFLTLLLKNQRFDYIIILNCLILLKILLKWPK